MKFDVLIIGGGTSGSAAGIQSARLGAKTLIIEETPWLGGMITSAGVSAFDGNKYAVGGGIFNELRKKIEDYYGGADKTYTGWISLTCFEPKVGKMFLHEMADAEDNLSVWFNTSFIKVLKENNKIVGAIVKKESEEEVEVFAEVVIDATEYGDAIVSAGIPYRLGRDSKADTGEVDAPKFADDEIQDMTFCAILKKYNGKAPEVLPSKDYKPELFKNSIEDDSDTKNEKYLNHKLHNWDSFISYAALPNDKYLLNWPFRSNDYYPTPRELYENPETRNYHYQKSKEHTLNYVHYMQTKMGHPEWGLATDEFPTEDHLPFIPYIRESRRMKGLHLLKENEVIPQENSFRPPLQKNSIAVGDYFLDHHHSSFFRPPDERLIENLPANAPFQIPFGCLIPEEVDGFIAAEKSISVTHIVNGCSRLQPVVMLIGQATGAIAALSLKRKINVRDVSINELQDVLIKAGSQLFPYKDLYGDNPVFEAAQKLALKGIYVDNPEFTFNAEEYVTDEEAENYFKKVNFKQISITDIIGLKRNDAFLLMFYNIK